MGKEFLKLKTDSKNTGWVLLTVGMILTLSMGILAYRNTELDKEYELPKNELSEGAYMQEMIAYVGEERIPLTVTVEARSLSKEETQKELDRAEKLLGDILKGKNESLEKITTDLNFAEEIPDTCVEVHWTEWGLEYFYSDGKLREDLKLSEKVEVNISAILTCQESVREYETTVTILPIKQKMESSLQEMIYRENEGTSEKENLVLPKEYEGEKIIWKKPLDVTFLWVLALTVSTAFALKIGRKRDEKEAKKERLEELERDYAQIVSKFAMLLSAGLSVRNAWERIVLMYRRRGVQSAVYEELNWGLLQMQKGISELEVYESVGIRTGQVHYKKLMALFISDKRRGSIPLMEAMNQEMFSAMEEKRRKTRQQGEKIGTKLLIPMIGMLGVVFLIILVPAFLSFGL